MLNTVMHYMYMYIYIYLKPPTSKMKHVSIILSVSIIL